MFHPMIRKVILAEILLDVGLVKDLTANLPQFNLKSMLSLKSTNQLSMLR